MWVWQLAAAVAALGLALSNPNQLELSELARSTQTHSLTHSLTESHTFTFDIQRATLETAEQPNGHLGIQRYPELPQDMWMLWSHWVGSIWGEIRGLFGSSVEKNWFSGQKCIFWGQNPNFFERHQIFCYHHDKTPKKQLDPVAIGTSGWPLHSLFGSKRAILGHRCQKTARRAAERARNGKPKVSRVTSGHGEVMIP